MFSGVTIKLGAIAGRGDPRGAARRGRAWGWVRRVTARFDSLDYVRRLEEVGVERRVAEAQAEVATRDDIDRLRTEIDRLRTEVAADHRRLDERFDGLEQRMSGKFDALAQEFDGKLERLGQGMTIRLGTMLVIGIGALVALDRLLG